MRAECIAIGTELLTTRRVDTNSVWLGERLAALGLAFHRKTCVGDSREDLRNLFQEALDRSDLVICTGGLGPTFDDFTKELWAELLGADLVESADVCQQIRARFEARGVHDIPASNWKQALVPVGATPLSNALGTAPGYLWEDPTGFPGRWVVMLPGVPAEMKHIWLEHLEPRLRAKTCTAPVSTLHIRTAGWGESAMDARTASLRERYGNLAWTILAGAGEVELVARSTDESALDAARRAFTKALGTDLVSVDGATLEEVILETLRQRGQRLALAESVTAGRIAARLTALPGASEVFNGGAVVYTAVAKQCLAGLDEPFLAAHGTVSDATTRALAENIRRTLQVDWALAVTGNAGPTEDASSSVGLGTCFAAVAGPKGTITAQASFPGERTEVLVRMTSWSLDQLRRALA